MAAGDIKGDQPEIITVTYGATVAIGDVVHIESDGKWDPVTSGDTGKFGVAIDAGGDTETGRVLILGRVEVANGSTTTIPKGATVMPYTAGTVMLATAPATTSIVGVAGTAMEAIAGSTTGTIYLGLGEGA
jgi:hypothetical protein